MKRSKKMTLILVAAMVMTVAMVVVAYADYVHNPAWNSGTGRFTQVYDMSIDTNWSYTLEFNTNVVEKKFADRGGLVQCTSNGLTAFPTYYKICSSGISTLSHELSMTGLDVDVINYKSSVRSGTMTCLAIRNDPRYNTTTNNKGNWSPDTY